MIRLTVLPISIVILISNAALAQDWNQWRGPNRDAVVASFSPPNTWPDKLKPIWKVQVGVGHSSPVVSDDKLYTLGISGILSCYDATSGKLLWRREFSKKEKPTSPLYGTAMSP